MHTWGDNKTKVLQVLKTCMLMVLFLPLMTGILFWLIVVFGGGIVILFHSADLASLFHFIKIFLSLIVIGYLTFWNTSLIVGLLCGVSSLFQKRLFLIEYPLYSLIGIILTPKSYVTIAVINNEWVDTTLLKFYGDGLVFALTYIIAALLWCLASRFNKIKPASTSPTP